MNWQEVCDDPHLRDLPYKVELNQHGQIVMSPASNQHGKFQTLIAAGLLTRADGGEVITETSIDTGQGTKVADVSWGSAGFYKSCGIVTPLPKAPELCVEIVSPSNSSGEMEEKAGLYFGHGAKEVWLCDEEGTIEFRSPEGLLQKSALFPSFPASL